MTAKAYKIAKSFAKGIGLLLYQGSYFPCYYDIKGEDKPKGSEKQESYYYTQQHLPPYLGKIVAVNNMPFMTKQQNAVSWQNRGSHQHAFHDKTAERRVLAKSWSRTYLPSLTTNAGTPCLGAKSWSQQQPRWEIENEKPTNTDDARNHSTQLKRKCIM